MKNIKKLVATLTLVGIIIIGSTNARAGFMLSDFAGGDEQQASQPCRETSETKVDNGILVGFTGILVGFTGILVGFSDTDKEVTNCGILVGKE